MTKLSDLIAPQQQASPRMEQLLPQEPQAKRLSDLIPQDAPVLEPSESPNVRSFQPLRDLGAGAENALRQFTAGRVEDVFTLLTAAPGSEGAENLFPGAAWVLYGLASEISRAATGNKLPGGDRALELSANIEEIANRWSGARPVANAADVMYRHAPFPASFGSLRAPVKGAADVTKRILAEVTLPGVQITHPVGIALNTALPLGATEGIDVAMSEEGGLPGYTGLHESFDETTEEAAKRWGARVGVAGAVGLGVASAITLRNRVAARNAPPSFFSGTREKEEVIGLIDKLETRLLDANNSTKAALLGAPGGERLIDRIDTTLLSPAIGAKMKEFSISGRFPRSGIQVPSLSRISRMVGTLDDAEYNLLNDALRAQSNLDIMNALPANHPNKYRVSLHSNPNTVMTTADFQAAVNAGHANPRVAAMMGHIRTYYSGFADYLEEAGVISNRTRQIWRQNYNNYSPAGINFVEEAFDPSRPLSGENLGKLVGRVLEEPTTAVDETAMLRNLRYRESVLAPDEGIAPLDLISEYTNNAIQFTERMRLRRDIMDSLHQVPELQRVVRAPGEFSSTSNQLMVLRNGRREMWQVNSPELLYALQFQPNSVFPILNAPRKLAQHFITGLMNPAFVKWSWFYEGFTMNQARGKGQPFGLLDEAAVRANKEHLAPSKLVGIDPTVFLGPGVPGVGHLPVSAVTSSGRGTGADMLRVISDNLYTAWATGGRSESRLASTIHNVFGPDMTRALADVASESWLNSMERWMLRAGGANAQFETSAEFMRFPSRIEGLGPEFIRKTSEHWGTAKANMLWRGYKSLLHHMHAAMRHQFFSANFGVDPRTGNRIPMDTQTEEALNALESLGAATRSVGGDPARAGSSKAVRAVAQNALYANIGMQVAANQWKALKANPRRYMATLAGLTTASMAWLAYQFQDNPEAARHYFNELSPQQREAAIYVYGQDGEGKPIIIEEFPVEHLARPFYSFAIEALGTMLGWKDGAGVNPMGNLVEGDMQKFRRSMAAVLDADWTETDTEDLLSGQRSAFGAIAFNPIGVTPGVVLNMAGVDPESVVDTVLPEFFSGESFKFPRKLQGERVTGSGMRFVDGVFDEKTAAIIEEFTGGAMVPFLSMIEAYARQTGAGADFETAMKSVGSYASDRLSRRVPGVPRPDFDNAQIMKSVTTRSATAKIVGKDLNTLQELNNLERTRMRPTSLSRQTSSPTVPTDPRALEIIARGAELYDDITNRYLKRITELQTERDDVRSDIFGSFSAQHVQTVRNQKSKEIRKLYEEAYEKIMIEEDLIASDVLGEPFSFHEFDPYQFEPPQ